MSHLRKILLTTLSGFIISCGDYEGSYDNGLGNDDTANGNEGVSSAPDDNLSHNAGANCLNSGCHNGDNANIKTFSVAGTVYKSDGTIQTNATVSLYVPNSNFLLASITTDNSGNFFTEEAVSGLAQGVSVEVEGDIGIRAMTMNPTVGSCNSCHNGTDRARIIAD